MRVAEPIEPDEWTLRELQMLARPGQMEARLQTSITRGARAAWRRTRLEAGAEHDNLLQRTFRGLRQSAQARPQLARSRRIGHRRPKVNEVQAQEFVDALNLRTAEPCRWCPVTKKPDRSHWLLGVDSLEIDDALSLGLAESGWNAQRIEALSVVFRQKEGAARAYGVIVLVPRASSACAEGAKPGAQGLDDLSEAGGQARSRFRSGHDRHVFRRVTRQKHLEIHGGVSKSEKSKRKGPRRGALSNRAAPCPGGASKVGQSQALLAPHLTCELQCYGF